MQAAPRQALPLLLQATNQTILNILSSTAASLPQLLQAHARVLKTGESSETDLTHKLISLYASHHCFSDAELVFDSIPQPRGHEPDFHVLPSVVKACAGLSALERGQEVHAIVSTSGCASDTFVQSSLVHMYLKCDRLNDARMVFDRIPEPDVVTWSALVSGYARHGLAKEAKDLFDEMGISGLEPNLVSWNGMISGFNQSGLYHEAALLMRRMHFKGAKPDGTSVSSVLSAVGNLEGSVMGTQIHGYAIKEGLASDKCVASALIDMYGRCSCACEMSRVFDEMEPIDLACCSALVAGLSRNALVDNALNAFAQFRNQNVDLNVVSWTSIIACCSQNGRDVSALELFRDMQVAGVRPNFTTLACLLPACGNIAALTHGKAAHCFCVRKGICDDVYVGSALVDMYGNCGRIHAARLCFDAIPIKNLACWNAIMNGYSMHGRAEETTEVFHLMQRSGQKPDSISFTCLLSAFSHGGLTDKGWYYFNSMSKEHGLEARMEQYACMVTLLGRAGKLDEAYNMIKKMPFEPDSCVWGALLSSCRVHKNVTLGEAAAEKLFEMEPANPGNYVLLSNVYASKRMWREVDILRDKMKRTGLKKNPGCSWIEIKKQVHVLLAGDNMHPQMTQIRVKLNELSMAMKSSGCFPVSEFVLQDVEEQDKELLLCGHSEKLAVVLGLLNTSPGSPIQVIKNIRCCGDCHAVIKFISSIEKREIFVRDTNRFHHFKGGECSCRDYW